jgi:predicted nucleic acid-binding protein
MAERERVYVETTVVSYLTARPSRDLIVAGHQQITHDWWDTRRGDFELCVSQLVFQEAGDGDPQAAQERLAVLATMTQLEIRDEAVSLAEELVRAGALPMKAENDALHIAVASVHRVPYLVTWNCRHLANATMRSQIERVCASKEFKAPIICTPEEMMEAKT